MAQASTTIGASSSPTVATDRHGPGPLATTVGLALSYALLAIFGLHWAAVQHLAAPVWPAAGIGLAVLVLAGPRHAAGIALGYVLAALVVGMPRPASVMLAIAAGNTVAALGGRWLLVRLRFAPTFEGFRDIFVFAAGAAFAAALAALAGTLTIGLALGAGAPHATTALHWFLADFTGVLVAGSLVLAWARAGWQRPISWWLELTACLSAIGLVGSYVFLGDGYRAYTFLAFVPLIWAALSLRLRGATLACAVLAVFGIAGTTLGLGQFGQLGLHARYLDLQLFITVSTLATLVLAVVVDERRAQRALTLSEARLQLALEASNTGLWKMDLQDGSMSFSPECMRITGLSRHDVELTRAGMLRLLHPEDLSRVRHQFRDALANRALYESEFRLLRPDGSVLWLEVRGRASFDADGRASTMLGTLTDITAHRRDERRLAEQARLLDLTTDAILIRDLDGRITYWNDGSVRLYGYTREQAVGRIASELLHTRFPVPLDELAEALQRDEHWEGEVVHHRRDGEPRIIHSRWVLTRGADGRPHSVMQTHTDITARRRSDDATAFLAQLDDRIARAAGADDVAEAGLALLGRHLRVMRSTLSDIDVEQGRIRTLHEWTDGAPRVTGTFDAREFFATELGITLASGEAVAIGDLRRDPLTAAFAQNYLPYETIALAATSYVIEGRLAGTLTVSSREPRVWRSDEIQLLREVVARLWPAIERAKALAALRESEARFRNLADTAPIMIWVADAENHCSYVSRRWTEFTGRDAAAELDFGWKDVVHPDDLPGYGARFAAAAQHNASFADEYRALRWDGAYRWLHVTARPRFGAGSEFLGYIGAVMDVTERRDAEDALREADRRKDEFLATLAHELRNPLSPIRTGLEVLNLTDDVETARRTRQMMERQLGHMVRLIDDLLDVSRITSGKVVLQRDRLPLQDAALAAIESARPLVEAARHRLVIELPDAPLWIDADPTRIAQVMGNLLTNAAKYTPDGGEIRLRVFESGDAACVSVSDTGLGIPPESLADVFGMFAQVNRTLDRSQGGLGIGLALARRLVEMHGGTIAAASDGLGRGSTFTVRLPRSFAIDAPRPSAPSVPAVVPKRRVLVVDDNRDAAGTLALMLELDGHDSRVAYSGADGLHAAEEFQPDVAILDIGMPGMNGYELARRLRGMRDFRHLRLIAVSGWGGEEDKRQAADAGFDLHLTKPVSVDAVQRAVVGH